MTGLPRFVADRPPPSSRHITKRYQPPSPASLISMATAVASHAHPATSTGLDHRKIAIWAFIGSECMLFASLISTYPDLQGPQRRGAIPHEACLPPVCAVPLKAILNIPVTSISTFVLLMSSLAMVLALAAVENRGKPGYEGILGSSKFWLLMTAILGTTFLGFQAFEFTSFVHEDSTIRTNLFGSTFFTFDGLPRRARDGRRPVATDVARDRHEARTPTEGRAARGHLGAVLALRRRGLDRDLHPRLPHPIALGSD